MQVHIPVKFVILKIWSQSTGKMVGAAVGAAAGAAQKSTGSASLCEKKIRPTGLWIRIDLNPDPDPAF
jgi:hypothetical protein